MPIVWALVLYTLMVRKGEASTIEGARKRERGFGLFWEKGGVDGNPPLLHAFAFEDYDGGWGGLAGAILLPPPLCTMKAVSFPCWLVVGWDFCISFSTLLPFLCAREGGGRTASLLLLRLFLFFLKKNLPFLGVLRVTRAYLC